MIVTATMPVTKLCPYVDEVDYGTLTATWEGDAPELHELARVVHALANERLTHEDYTARVQHLLSAATVETEWQTGPWVVIVTA